jgi:hypothetical protein
VSLDQTPSTLTSNVSQGNRFQYTPYGMAMLSGGLVQITSINGVGLLTNGFIWQAPSIWFDPQAFDGVSTTWAAAYGYPGSSFNILTGWTASAGYSGCAAASLIATSWASSQSFADEFPL